MVPASSGPAARRSWGTGGVAGGQGASRRGEHDFPLDVYVPLEDGGVVQAGHADGFAVTERGEGRGGDLRGWHGGDGELAGVHSGDLVEFDGNHAGAAGLGLYAGAGEFAGQAWVKAIR